MKLILKGLIRAMAQFLVGLRMLNLREAGQKMVENLQASRSVEHKMNLLVKIN
jgi:hypothetical protein